MSQDGRVIRENGNVTIIAPPAIAGVRDLDSLRAHSPVEYAQELERRIMELGAERLRDKTALDTLSNIVAALVKVASPNALEVMIQRDVSDFMEGANITVEEAPGTRDVIVRVRERAPHPVWEGRHG